MSVTLAQPRVYNHVNAASISFTLAAAPTPGNLLVIDMMGNDGFTAPAGWTTLYPGTPISEQSGVYLFARVAQAGDTAGPYTCSGSSAGWDSGGSLTEYAGSTGIPTNFAPSNSTFTSGAPNTNAATASVVAAVGDYARFVSNVGGATTAFSDGTDTVSGMVVDYHALWNLSGVYFIDIMAGLSVTSAGAIEPTASMSSALPGVTSPQAALVYVISAAASATGNAVGNGDYPAGAIGNGGVFGGTTGNSIPSAA
jgi:hypothetical protein